MPEQPPDPIHYDMKIPPEPKHPEAERDSAKKHGDKIDTGEAAHQADKKPDDPNTE